MPLIQGTLLDSEYSRILEWVTISSFQGSFTVQGSNPRLLRLLHCRLDSLPLILLGISKTVYAAAAKLLQSCPTLCDPIDGSQPGLPWDSPSKDTGVDCHFLLQCMKVKTEKEVAQSCPTLRDPMDCSLPGSYIRGICQARVLEWGAIAFSNQPLPFLTVVGFLSISVLISSDPSPRHHTLLYPLRQSP